MSSFSHYLVWSIDVDKRLLQWRLILSRLNFWSIRETSAPDARKHVQGTVLAYWHCIYSLIRIQRVPAAILNPWVSPLMLARTAALMSDSQRLVLKLLWMAFLVGALVLFEQVPHEFVYRAF